MRWRSVFRLPRSPDQIRADVDEELRFDLEMRACELARQGMSDDDARQRAAAEFGDLEATRRYCEATDMRAERDDRRSDLLGDLTSDLAIAWRGMRRSPGFALVVMATLALGIGANTAVFSVVRRVLVAPLPYASPDQLYRLYTDPPGDVDKLSLAELTALAAESRALAGVTVFGNYGGITYTDDQTAEPWQFAKVASNFFAVLGIRPALGRGFTDADAQQAAAPTVIISDALWRSRFGADPHVLGRKVQLNNVAFTIIGVLPANFVAPTFVADALLPLDVAGLLRQGRQGATRAWRAVARVKAGVTLTAFRSDLDVIRPRIRAQLPDIKSAGIIKPVPLHAAIVGGSRVVLLLVMGAAALVLVVACENIAGLFLSRAAARRRELGVRAALGAGRARLVRQVLTESALYGIGGGAAGVALAFLLERVFLSMAGRTLPHLGDVRIDMVVLVFAAALSIACGLAFGVMPALAATRIDVRDSLGDSGARGASRGRAGTRGSRVLVAAQLAVAIVLLVGAGLLMRTFVGLVRTDVGYRTDSHVLTFRVNLPAARYPDPDARAGLFREFMDRVRAIPGVQSVGFTAVSPWNGGWKSVGVRVQGRPIDDNTLPNVDYASASDDFFSALGIRLLAGRAFEPADRIGSPPVILVSASAAKKLWPGTSPIGAQVRLDTGGPDSSAVREVVGVVADVRPNAMNDAEPTLYVSESQFPYYGGEFAVRASSDAIGLVPRITQLLRGLDSKLPVIGARTMHDVVNESIARQRLAMALIGAFAALALLLGSLGVYSVMAYAVLARTREFGIRAALGARRSTILSLVMRQGLATTMFGVAAGVALAALLSRFLSSLLVGVSPYDPAAFVGAVSVLAIVATAACLVPARAATKVDPVDALRSE